MAWVEADGDTTTLTGGSTVDTLATETGAGVYSFSVDLNNMALGDAIEVRISTKVRAGATSRVVARYYFNNVQGDPNWQSPQIVVITEIVVAMIQSAGTGRAVTWSLDYDAGEPSAATIADAVWDEAKSGHTTAATFGAAFATAIGTAQGGTATTIQLASGAVTADDQFNGGFVAIVAGTGAGQQRGIIDTVNATDTLTVADWTENPDSTSVYCVFMN